MFISKVPARRRAAEDFVHWAISAGKPINCIRDQILHLHTTHPNETENLVRHLPSLPGQVTERAGTVRP